MKRRRTMNLAYNVAKNMTTIMLVKQLNITYNRKLKLSNVF